jgi:ribosomal protein S12 methylthiotransferase
LVGFGDYHRIDRIVEDLVGDHAAPEFGAERRRVDAALTPRHYAYLKISEGCDHTCAFCVIPSIRGAMRSFPTEDLVDRARGLAERGVREINVVAQDSTVYGSDLYGELRLPQLLRRLDDVEGLDWIRLLYAYPTEVTDSLIDVLANGKRVLPWLDVPIQHASDNVLARMKRGHGRAVLERLVERLRKAHPRFAIRTTVIVGFPGETDADFEALLEFLAWAKFDRLGAFRYSREPGSAAGSRRTGSGTGEGRALASPHGLAATTRVRRRSARVGSTIDVLVDAAQEGPRPARRRAWLDAPEIDANVLVEDATLKAGDRVNVRVTEARGYDLVGVRA